MDGAEGQRGMMGPTVQHRYGSPELLNNESFETLVDEFDARRTRDLHCGLANNDHMPHDSVNA